MTTTAIHDGFKKSLFDWPPKSQSIFDDPHSNTKFLRPFRSRKSLPVVLNESGDPPVFNLLRLSGPFAVVRRIVSIVIDPVNRMFGTGGWPHVCNEVGKIEPSLANSNTSSAVVAKFGIGRVIASIKHVMPSPVLFCSPAKFWAGCISMFKAAASGYVPLKASAGLCVAAFKLVPKRKYCFATRANTYPASPAANLSGVFGGYKKPTERSTREVFRCFHFFTLKWLTVMGAWQSAVKPIFGSYPSHAIPILPRIAT